ncbi:MAG: COX15/CtaA family protein [Flavobacteriales bacterium]|nr:COX15/CtaA family protein [Flavobacteriales bacterium]
MKTNPNRPVILWLLSGCLLIFIMVLVGGITRLTHSGLSMVDWNLFMGAIPPMNEVEWQETFDQYKQFPEYQQVNFTFSLEEFKSIFFWEYLHRLIGRLIGMVFIIPFVYFLIRKRLSGKLIRQCLLILAMGAFQGFLGWWMVKSGLVDNPDVSHIRLATHLMAAFITFAYTFWVALGLMREGRETTNAPSLRYWLQALLVFLLLQITYGAFVAGLNAGFVMNTWPKMGDRWIADSVTALKPLMSNFIDGIGGVQFVHRYLAYVVVAIVLIILFKSSRFELVSLQKQALKYLLIVVFIQFLLGIFTLLYAVPVTLGVLHQLGAFFLLGAVVNALQAFRRT